MTKLDRDFRHASCRNTEISGHCSIYDGYTHDICVIGGQQTFLMREPEVTTMIHWHFLEPTVLRDGGWLLLDEDLPLQEARGCQASRVAQIRMKQRDILLTPMLVGFQVSAQ